MVKKTNNVVYVYKLKLPKTYDAKYFTSKFSKRSIKKNIYYFEDTGYSGCLIFEGEGNGGLFFTFSKVKNKQFIITDTKKNTQEVSTLEEWQKHTNSSYFAYYPEKNIMLGLYNNDAMQHIISPLMKYFKDHVKEENFEGEMIEKKRNPTRILGMATRINQVIVKTAHKKIDKSAEETNEDPFSAVKKYKRSGSTVIYFNRLGNHPVKDVAGVILSKILNRRSAKSVYIKGDGLNVDLLGMEMMSFPCAVNTDKHDIALFSDFRTKAQKIFQDNKNGSFNEF